MTERRDGETLTIRAESREALQQMALDRFGLQVSLEELFPN